MSQNIEIVKLQVRRGLEKDLPTLDVGEPAITIDTNKMFIGDGIVNHEIAKVADLNTTNNSVNDILQNKLAAKVDATAMPLKADVSYVDTKVAAVASGAPKGVYTKLTDLQTAKPTGDSNVYLVTGNIVEVETLNITAAPTVAGNVAVTLNGNTTNVAVTNGVAEVDKLTVSGGPTTAGTSNVIVTLNGVATNVSVNGGTKEVDTLTVGNGATTAGNITVTLNGVATTIAVAASDSASAVATKIAAGTFTGWTASASSNVVTFTKSTVGTNTAPSFTDTGTTGVTATSFTATTTGIAADSTSGVATKIAAGTFTGWTASASSNVVTFTKSTVGTVSASTFSAGTTGTSATFAVTTIGVASDTTSTVASKIRGTSFSGWATGGTGTNVTFTKSSGGTNTAPTYSDGGTGATGTMAVLTAGTAPDGNWYYYNGGWKPGGIYQGSSLDFNMFDNKNKQLLGLPLVGIDNTMVITDTLLSSSTTMSTFNGGTGLAPTDITTTPIVGLNVRGNMATWTAKAGTSTGAAVGKATGTPLFDFSTGGYKVGDYIQFGFFINYTNTGNPSTGPVGMYMGTGVGTFIAPDYYNLGNGWYFAYKEYQLTAADLVKDTAHGVIQCLAFRNNSINTVDISMKMASPIITIGSTLCNIFRRVLEQTIISNAQYDNFTDYTKLRLTTRMLEGRDNQVYTNDPGLTNSGTLITYTNAGPSSTVTYAKDPTTPFRGNVATITVPAGSSSGAELIIGKSLSDGSVAVGDVLQVGFFSDQPSNATFDHFEPVLGSFGAQLKPLFNIYNFGEGWYYYYLSYTFTAADLVADSTHGSIGELMWRYNNTASSTPFVFKIGFPMMAIGKKPCDLMARAFDLRLQTQLPKLDWSGKKWVTYGDSITAINNTNDPKSWGMLASNYHLFGTQLGRGIGSSTVCLSTQIWYANSDGSYNSRDIDYASPPAGTTAHKGYFCSWDRIKTMIPQDSNLVFVMGGTNDWGANKPSGDYTWVPNSTLDTDWAADATYYNGGDFNINTFKGAVASTVMKIQAWCPNAVIVLGSPLSGKSSTAGQNMTTQVANSSGFVMEDYRNWVQDAALWMSTPFIDVFGTTGINQLNSSQFIADGTHPYAIGSSNKGNESLARAVIGGLKNIIPHLS